MRSTSRIPAVALGVALIVAGPAAAASSRVLVHRCLEVSGEWADLGLRMSMLTGAADCPVGAFGAGAMSRGAVLLLSAALPVLGVQAALGAAGLGLVALGARAARIVVRLARGLVAIPEANRTRRPVEVPVRSIVGTAVVVQILDAVRTCPYRGPPLPA